MPLNIIIGNIISFVAAMFMTTSCLIKDKKKIFFLQSMECITLAVASVFFKAYAGVATLLISALRNYIVSKDKFSTKVMYIFIALTAFLGFLTNNRGVIGLIPVAATIQFTLCQKYCKKLFSIKLMIFVNTFAWVVYSLIIKDYSTAFFYIIATTACLVSIISMLVNSYKHR